jgi:hypothetical protein
MSNTVVGYMLAYSDEYYEGPSILPSGDLMPRQIYRTIDDAEAALEKWKNKLSTFQPIMYGEVYPYDKTTAREQIQKKGYALYGWTTDDTDDEPVRYGLFIMAVIIS